jgi:hypothetical protein
MQNKELTHITGTFLIDANASFLNGAGIAVGERENYTKVKTFFDGWSSKGRYQVPFVSAASWRRWLRDTLIEETGWKESVIRALHKNAKGNTDKIGTERDPIKFAEDDLGENINKPLQHSKGQSILYRQVHFRPQLDLYLTNLDFFDYFNNTIAPLALGRSQDLCWIKKVEVVDLTPTKSGNIGSTMISNRFLKTYLSPELTRCPEWFDNDIDGVTRRVGAMGFFQVISHDNPNRTNVTMDHLYHPSNLENHEDVIYLHEWSTPLVRVPPPPKKKGAGK